jgi:hypothetical protein
MDQEGERKRTTDDVSKCINDDIKSGIAPLSRDQSRGNLSTAWMVSSIKVARAWARLLCGTWEPVALMSREKRKWLHPQA